MIMESRYQRHIQLNEVGSLGQEKIKQAKVLVIGVGGLGCPALQYLAAAGLGTLGMMDPDLVSLSNLQRQILFNENDLGKNKALSAEKHLQKLNSEIQIQAFPFALTHENAEEFISEFDIVIDGTDNFYTRYLISDQCILQDKVMVYGALYKFEGQVSVFNYQGGPSYRCLFPTPPTSEEIPNCNEIGVFGVVPGIIGVYQATETIKIILGLGNILSSKLLFVNLLNHQNTVLDFDKNQREIDHIKRQGKAIPIENQDCLLDFEVSLEQLSAKEKIKWIDVREQDELPRLNYLNPLSPNVSVDVLMESKQKIIAFCQTGTRSKVFVEKMKRKGIKNCYSLKEGAKQLQEWAKKR
ncbi:HesA/MoeB/ThiF family protein [Flavobacteriaceae bacterium]|nr:HesA/MoeB/ThiF family protein [Flavobacteriaceae bacterium]